jgi:hypothetical protein
MEQNTAKLVKTDEGDKYNSIIIMSKSDYMNKIYGSITSSQFNNSVSDPTNDCQR